jgi:hypothetical protein
LHPRWQRHVLAAALCPIGTVQAAEIDAGNPDLVVRFDKTIKYNISARLRKQDAALLKSPNVDEGNRNRAIIANRLDLLSELDVMYQKEMGERISAATRYDRAYTSCDNTKVVSSNHRERGKPAIGLPDYALRYHYKSGEVLDAFVSTNVELAEMSFAIY